MIIGWIVAVVEVEKRPHAAASHAGAAALSTPDVEKSAYVAVAETSASTAATAAYPTTTDPAAAATSTRMRSDRENSGGRTVVTSRVTSRCSTGTSPLCHSG